MGLRPRWRALRGQFVVRLVAGFLVASVPVTVAVAVILTRESSNSLTAGARSNSELLARTITTNVGDFLAERRQDLDLIGAQASAGLADPGVASIVSRVAKLSTNFDLVEVTDLTGRVVASSRSDGGFDPSGQPWFRAVAGGQSVVSSPIELAGDFRWYLATAVLDPSGRPLGVVVGDIDEAVLSDLLKDEHDDQGTHVLIADKERHLVYDTSMGSLDGPALLAKGALRTSLDNVAVTRAVAGESGSAIFSDRGTKVVAGFDHVAAADLVIVVEQPDRRLLAPVRRARDLAIVVTVLGTALAIGFSVVFARRTTRPIVALANGAAAVARGDLTVVVDPGGSDELRRLAVTFNAMVAGLRSLVAQLRSASADVSSAAAELSASSEELAATTTEQSAAVTEVSATTEELARASGSIADTVDEVAAQSAETRDNLEQAESDIMASSERTLALADRVGEIGAILTLINEIADQTNLLALNAAIEAARAGDSGRGFAVVAEEVRRLAERSKASAAEIAIIVEGVHAETAATVMAMEKGASQMQRGLRLLEGVTDATAQVRLTTQQQHSATAQVVETMEQLTDASRQVSATAQQIAGAAALLASLSADLRATAEHQGGRADR